MGPGTAAHVQSAILHCSEGLMCQLLSRRAIPVRLCCAPPRQVKCSLLILDLPSWEELTVSLFSTLLDVVK